MEVAQLLLGIARRCPKLDVQALDSEAFFGVTLSDLQRMAEEAEAEAEAGTTGGDAAGGGGGGARGGAAAPLSGQGEAGVNSP